MHIYQPMAARLLRRFRLRNNFTLEQASPLLDTSPAALSRKERGEKPVQRTDVRNAIAAYRLTPWEAYELWLAAGFIPEQRKPHLTANSVCELVEPLLSSVTYPAAIIDQVGYIKSWNSEYESIWKLADTEPEPHYIEQLWRRKDLFLSHDSWSRYALHALKLFYNKTLRATGKPELESILKRLREAHGEEFTQRWDQAQCHAITFDFVDDAAQNGEVPILDTYGMTLLHKTNGCASIHSNGVHAGAVLVKEIATEIEYMTVQSMVECLADYEMTIYLPLGASNQERYAQWRQHIDGSRTYCA